MTIAFRVTGGVNGSIGLIDAIEGVPYAVGGGICYMFVSLSSLVSMRFLSRRKKRGCTHLHRLA